MYDVAIYVGRFQPFHSGHLATALHGLTVARSLVIVVGSCGAEESTRNPWSYEDRAMMIMLALYQSCVEPLRVQVVPMPDFDDDERWVDEILACTPSDNACLVGVDKDASTYYLKMLEEHLPFVPSFHHDGWDATRIRHLYFTRRLFSLDLPDSTAIFLKSTMDTPHFQRVAKLYEGENERANENIHRRLG